jgi:hypothetical protein
LRARPIANDDLVMSMLVAVDFDHKAGAQAAEVDDIAANIDLTAKMGALQGEMLAQVPPQAPFRLG